MDPNHSINISPTSPLQEDLRSHCSAAFVLIIKSIGSRSIIMIRQSKKDYLSYDSVDLQKHWI